MAEELDTAIAFGSAAQKDSNRRGAEDTGVDVSKDADLKQNQFYNKINQKSDAQKAEAPKLVEEEKIGGAFYLPLKSKDLDATWGAITEALKSLKNCDVNIEKDSFNAFGLQYYHDTFMLARTRLCKLEKEDGQFLEIHRLQGDGFVFADEFKKNLVKGLDNFVQDVKCVDPVPSENARDAKLNYLDLSDEAIASGMIQHWLQTLKPKGGVKYDHRQIYETISSLGWNLNDEANFKVLNDYSDYIVGPVMEILRHPETTFVPTAYFGVMAIKAFVAAKAVPKDMQSWKSVLMLVEALEKFCLTEQPAKAKGIADSQVTRSREVLGQIVSILKEFVPLATGDKPANLGAKVDVVLKALAGTQEAKTLQSLLKDEEEEVEAA